MKDELQAELAAAGLGFVRMVGANAPFVPPQVAGFASSCGNDDVLLGESISLKDASLVERVNSAWYQVACEGGLFQEEDRRFLLAVERKAAGGGNGLWWVEVELLDTWDLAGAGAAGGLLGLSRGRPSFTMLALSGEVIVRVTCGEVSADIVQVSQPYRIDVLRLQAEFMVGWRDTDEFTRATIRRWIDANAGSAH